jgi:alpha-1,2-mannosyltransferase
VLLATVIGLRMVGSRSTTPSIDPVIPPGVAAAVIAEGGLPPQGTGPGETGPQDHGRTDRDDASDRLEPAGRRAAEMADDLVGTAGERLDETPDQGPARTV